jgi:hypothetical protein
MSGIIVKGIKRSSTLLSSRRTATSAAKNRTLAGKSSRLKPIVKNQKAKKSPAKKATKVKLTAMPKGKKPLAKPVKPTKPVKSTKPKAVSPKLKAIAKKQIVRKKAVPKPKVTVKPNKTKIVKPVKKVTVSIKPKKKAVVSTKKAVVSAKKKAVVSTKKKVFVSPKATHKPVRKTAKPKANRAVIKTKPVKAATKIVLPPPRKPIPPPTPRTPSPNEAAALRAFEKAHREFVRGRFAEARNQFRELLEKHFTVAEVAARARTYLAIAETRLKTENSLPKDADALYDRGVIELNRGDYATAQDFFERALKREPDAAHIHYGLAATKAQLGATEDALKALEQAFSLKPILRFRAPQDQDLAPLHTIPEFEQLVTS